MIRKLAAALVALTLPAAAMADVLGGDRLNAVIDAAKFDGDVAISNQPDASSDYTCSYIGLRPEPARSDEDGLTWRWASVTKQMVAILAMQQVERGKIGLDTSVATYLPAFRSPNAGTATIRNLLQHRVGLPNPAHKKVAAAAFSQRKAFEFGEVWMGSGFSYDLLSADA